MKRLLPFLILFLLSIAAPLQAAEDAAGASGMAPHGLGKALLYMTVFAACGILIAIAGYKVFDLFTPGDLHKEILEKQNVAAAVVAGAIVLGICIIIAAAMIG